MEEWIPVTWQHKRQVATRDPFPVTIDAVFSRERETPRSAVRHGGLVLSVDGEWEYEPLRSQRDDAFLRNFRFDTIEAAKAAADRAVTKKDGVAA